MGCQVFYDWCPSYQNWKERSKKDKKGKSVSVEISSLLSHPSGRKYLHFQGRPHSKRRESECTCAESFSIVVFLLVNRNCFDVVSSQRLRKLTPTSNMPFQANYRLLQAVFRPHIFRVQRLPHLSRRSFRISRPRGTDGVYKQLTEMRVRTPWIEALRRSRETGTQSAAAASDPPKPDLTPKSMADSHFSFVLPLAQDRKLCAFMYLLYICLS